MAENLKHCPCCGGEARYFEKSTNDIGWDVVFNFTICCNKCGLKLPDDIYRIEIRMGKDGEFIVKNDDRKRAAEDWNRRVDDERTKAD